MTFWEAKDAVESGRVRRVRRAIWLDRWYHYSIAAWYRSPFSPYTGSIGPGRVVEAADLTPDDYRAEDWTIDPIPLVSAVLIAATVSTKFASGVARKYGYQGYVPVNGKFRFYLTRLGHTDTTLLQTATYDSPTSSYAFRRADDLVNNQSIYTINPATGAEAVVAGSGQSGTQTTTYTSPTEPSFNRSGTRTWVNGTYTTVGDSVPFDYTAMPWWGIISAPYRSIDIYYADVISTATRRINRTFEHWAGSYFDAPRSAHETGSNYWVTDVIADLSDEYTDAMLLTAALAARGAFGAASLGSIVARTTEDYVSGIYPRWTASAGKYTLTAEILSFDGIGHYRFGWTVVDPQGEIALHEVAVVPELGATTVTTPEIDAVPTGLGEWTVRDAYAVWVPTDIED